MHPPTPLKPTVMWPTRQQNGRSDSFQPAQATDRHGAHKAHNHPSNQVTPSTADEIITQRIKDALSLFDIRVIDHVVLGRESSYSFAQHGLI